MRYRIEVHVRPDVVLDGDRTFIDRLIAAASAAFDGFSVCAKSLTHVTAEVQTAGEAEALRVWLAALPNAADLRLSVTQAATEQPGALEKIDALVGSPEYKRLMHELYSVAPLVKRHATYDVFTNRCYLFSIGAGRGLTTALELFAELLCETGLFRFGEGKRVREGRLPDREADDDALCKLVTEGFGCGHIICVDITAWLGRLRDAAFKRFLSRIEDYATDNIVVFRVPLLEDDALENVRRSLGDILTVQTVTFEPFSPADLRECARRSLAAVGYTMADDAWSIFDALVGCERADGAFYGINTVNKIVREVIYEKQVFDAADGTDDCVIKPSEIGTLGVAAGYDTRSGEAILDGLVGMEHVRARIEEIVAQIEYAKTHDFEQPTLHMRFVGNPGTGKTTVARALGKLLAERGVLRKGAFFECAARSLCGQYLGQTAPRTAEICREAYGSVLFIDEAYALYRGERDGDAYGKEAIDTLIAEMENHRADFVVIMAGYPDEMQTLLDANPGLESRMPYVIEFPDYDRAALAEIFLRFCGGRIAVADDFAAAVQAYFAALPDAVLKSKNFSNARFVRNPFERTCGKATMRARLAGEAAVVLTKEDLRAAGSDREFAAMMEKKPKRMGFGI